MRNVHRFPSLSLAVLTALASISCGSTQTTAYPPAVTPVVSQIRHQGNTQSSRFPPCNNWIFAVNAGDQFVVSLVAVPQPSNIEVAINGLELPILQGSTPFGSTAAFKYDWSAPQSIVVSPQTTGNFVMRIRNVSINTSFQGTARISDPAAEKLGAPLCPDYENQAVPGGRIAFMSDRISAINAVFVMRGDETWGGRNLIRSSMPYAIPVGVGGTNTSSGLVTPTNENPVISMPVVVANGFGVGIRVAYERNVGDREIWVAPIDEQNAAKRVSMTPGNQTEPAFSPDGKLVWINNGDIFGRVNALTPTLEKRLTNTPFVESNPSFSPDGVTLAFVRAGNIWSMNVNTLHAVMLTAANVPAERNPVFSPDGSKIAFLRGNRLWIMNSTGGGEVALGAATGFSDDHPSFSMDGSTIAFDSRPPSGVPQIFTVSATGGPRTQLTTMGANYSPSWSPYPISSVMTTTSRIAFVSERDNNREIYIMTPDGLNQRNITNNPALDWNPHWR